jgi:hypothetical protein
MTQAQLLSEFRQLPLSQQLEMLQAALQIIAQQFQPGEQHTNGQQAHSPLSQAASLLLADYTEDKALTSFTVLDGEPFYAQE